MTVGGSRDFYSTPIKPFDSETLYWCGYVYRAWHFYTGESSKEIYRQAPISTMKAVYLPYHSMSVKMAVERLKETSQQIRIKR